MSLARVLRLLRKDLRLGPRSPIFLFAVILPVVMTFVVQVAFSALLEPAPRLGIVDRGDSQLTAEAQKLPGVAVTVLDDEAVLRRKVEAGDLDAGLVLEPGFDAALRAGRRPALPLYIGGESLASDRVILAVTTLDLVRAVEGKPPAANVEVVDLGAEKLSLSARLVPLIVMYALIMAGVFLTAFAVVDEREKRTLDALLVTPVRLSEVLLAKALLGFWVAVAMAIVTLALNGVLGSLPRRPAAERRRGRARGDVHRLGLRDRGARRADAVRADQGTGFLIVAPVVFYLFPDWPQWVARIFPTYWIIDPIYRLAIQGDALTDVWWELLIGLGIAGALTAGVVALARRMHGRLAAG